MTSKSPQKWGLSDYRTAMATAIRQQADERYLSKDGDKFKFNGFWRNGDKQNVCAWLDKASWHDAKTGEGGGCKEFAQTAFNMSLPEFMERFGSGHQIFSQKLDIKEALRGPDPITISKPVHEIWVELQKRDGTRPDNAASWLRETRGMKEPRFYIGSGFTNLDHGDVSLFESQHHSLINKRISLGPQLIAPLRGVYSDEVQNLFIRATTEVPKEDKSRLLTGAGGWHEPDKTPRAFGFPHLVHDFPNLILCEGMADYFAAEVLLRSEHNYLPLGATSASALPKWSEWLIKSSYKGRITLVNQWDENNSGRIGTDGVGPSKSIEALALLKTHGLKSNLFDWGFYLENITRHPEEIRDLADSLTTEARYQECGPGHLNYCFLIGLKEQGQST